MQPTISRELVPLFIAVPEMLQDGRGRKAGADAEGAAGQHFAGLQEGRKGRTPAATVKGCKIKLHRARSPKWLADQHTLTLSCSRTPTPLETQLQSPPEA